MLEMQKSKAKNANLLDTKSKTLDMNIRGTFVEKYTKLIKINK